MVFPEKALKPCTSNVWVHYSTRKPHENNNFASFYSSHLPFRAKRCIDPESRKMFQILYSNLMTIWILDQVRD